MTREERKAYMQFYKENQGRENDKLELPAEDVKRILKLNVSERVDVSSIEDAFQKFGHGRRNWSKPEYLQAMHYLNNNKQQPNVNNIHDTLQVMIPSLLNEVNLIRHAHQAIKQALEERILVQNQLRHELANLQTANQSFDDQYIANIAKLSGLQSTIAELEKSSAKLPSPRSDSALEKLNSFEASLANLEQQIFALVPIINKPETRTKLSILAGMCDEFQAKHVDAVQSLGFTSQDVISVRRKSLVRRLDILNALGRTLYKLL